jgi:hypothetical protein
MTTWDNDLKVTPTSALLMATWYPAPLFHLRWSHRELDDGHGSSLTPRIGKRPS